MCVGARARLGFMINYLHIFMAIMQIQSVSSAKVTELCTGLATQCLISSTDGVISTLSTADGAKEMITGSNVLMPHGKTSVVYAGNRTDRHSIFKNNRVLQCCVL